MNIRTKAILFVLLLITLLAAVYLTISINHQRQDLDQDIAAKKKQALSLTENLQKQAFAHYRTRIVSLATTKHKVIEAFAKRDRAQLYKVTNKFYKTISHENPYFQTIQFNLPDGTAFLRMHLPDFYGDDLSAVRPILPHVHRTKKQAAGYDIGRSGLYYRVVQPMFYQGEYIGSIGFGIKHVQLLELLRKEVSPHVALVTAASRWQEVSPELWNKMTRTKLPIIKQGDEVMLADSALFSSLSRANLAMAERRIRFDNRDYVLFSNITLNDYQDQPLAKVVFALDITDNIRELHNFVTKIVLITLALLVLIALVLHFSFGQLLDTILKLNHSLVQANEELEERVEERTAELATANQALKNEMAERQRIEEELRQAEKMRAIGTLASGIAHDFNNILTAILGYTHLALLKLQPGQEITLHLDEVQKAGMRAKDLVAQILSFSRQSEHKKKTLMIQPIIKEALKLIRASIPSHITIETHIAPQTCHVLVDPTQIHQLLMNLCTNAYHAMQDHDGTLTVRLDETEVNEKDTVPGLIPGSYLKLEVADTGEGMSPATMARIFEPYFSTKEVGKGTGLGLAVVHGIVQSYQGHISVTSTIGEGTTFTVLLPCQEGVDDDSCTEQEAATVAMGHGEHLLVIDDEQEILLFWEMLLTELGYRVTAMPNGPGAYHWLTDHVGDIDAVITDMSMPEMTGLDLSQKIKWLEPSMPIALCSGFASTELDERMAAVGVTAFIKKPLDHLEVSHILRDLLSS